MRRGKRPQHPATNDPERSLCILRREEEATGEAEEEDEEDREEEEEVTKEENEAAKEEKREMSRDSHASTAVEKDTRPLLARARRSLEGTNETTAVEMEKEGIGRRLR